MAESVNKQLQQMMITHAVYIEKYKTFEENKMLKILEAADEELKALLESKSMTGLSRARQEKLYDAIRSLEAGYATVFGEELRSDLKAFADREGGWTVDQLRKVTNPYMEIEFIAPSAAQIYAAAESSFLIMNNGVTLDLESIIESVFKGRAQIIEQSLRQGFILGKTNQEMVKELLGSEAMNYFDGNLRKAERSMKNVVGTSMSHMSNIARSEVYDENDDIVKGYKWISTLDSRTSAVCISYDSKVWYYDKSNIPNGASLLPHQVMPPAHWGVCRSTTVPLLKSWRELGINILEAPEGTRSALDGYVPASTTYADWFDKAGVDVQKEVLGPERFKMYQAGEMKVTQFMKDGSWLSLEQLKQRGH